MTTLVRLNILFPAQKHFPELAKHYNVDACLSFNADSFIPLFLKASFPDRVAFTILRQNAFNICDGFAAKGVPADGT